MWIQSPPFPCPFPSLPYLSSPHTPTHTGYGQAAYWDGYYKSPYDWAYLGPNQQRYSHQVHWYHKLLSDPAFKQRLIHRYRELREGEWRDGAIVGWLASYQDILGRGGAASRNFGRWPISHVSTHHKYIPIHSFGPTWEDNVAGLRDWVLRRLRWMDQYITQLG